MPEYRTGLVFAGNVASLIQRLMPNWPPYSSKAELFSTNLVNNLLVAMSLTSYQTDGQSTIPDRQHLLFDPN